MKKTVTVLLGLMLVGCTSSGVIPMGPDTYSISTTSELSPAYAKKNALQEASKFCISKNMEVMPVQTQQGSHRDSFGDNLATFDFTFRCLSKGDDDLGRPELKNETLDVNVKTEEVNPSKYDVYEELEKLSDLKERNIITEEEFEKQKRKLLNMQ